MPPRGSRAVSFWVKLAIVTALSAQVIVHRMAPAPVAIASALGPAPPLSTLLVASLGEPIGLAKLLMLRLQAFDNQPGVSIPFRDLDYARVESWLERILELDPLGQYPLLFASRLYGEVPVAQKQRRMLEFVYREFLKDPDRRWPWLAHSLIIARHRLKDIPLAMKYAQALRRFAIGPDVPHWAQQMEIFVLEDMNEVESAKILLGGLLASGTVTDPQEHHFLQGKLDELELRQSAKAKAQRGR